jgi:hypothetical protein
MWRSTALDARITRFACDLFIAGVPLGVACRAAEQVLNPQLPGYKERRGLGGMHEPLGDDSGLFDDDSSEWRGA